LRDVQRQQPDNGAGHRQGSDRDPLSADLSCDDRACLRADQSDRGDSGAKPDEMAENYLAESGGLLIGIFCNDQRGRAKTGIEPRLIGEHAERPDYQDQSYRRQRRPDGVWNPGR
jgi:hypothetical protein